MAAASKILKPALTAHHAGGGKSAAAGAAPQSMKIFFPALLLIAALRWAAGASAQEGPASGSRYGPVAALSKAIAGLCPTQCIPIETSGLGNFPWFYQDANQVFNADTLDFVSARVMPGPLDGTASLSAAGGYINAYAQVIAKLSYTLGSADQLRVHATAAASAKAAKATVATYEAIFGVITPADLDLARRACGSEAIQTNIDYVISYIMGSVWSGRGVAGMQPLTTAELSASGNLMGLLPLTPRKGDPVVALAGDYLSASQATSDIWSEVQAASWKINRLNQNTGFPTGGNGGMVTVNPQTGAVSTAYQPGYGIPRAVADISRDLNDPARVLRVDISSRSSSGTPQDYVLEFLGYTYVPIVPATWQAASGDGWYAGAPIAEATANANQDVTGYKFVYSPSYNMGNLAEGGNLGRLTGLLICKDIRATPMSVPTAGAAARPYAPAWTWTAIGAQDGSYAGRPLQQRAYVIAGTLEFPTPPALPALRTPVTLQVNRTSSGEHGADGGR